MMNSIKNKINGDIEIKKFIIVISLSLILKIISIIFIKIDVFSILNLLSDIFFAFFILFRFKVNNKFIIYPFVFRSVLLILLLMCRWIFGSSVAMVNLIPELLNLVLCIFFIISVTNCKDNVKPLRIICIVYIVSLVVNIISYSDYFGFFINYIIEDASNIIFCFLVYMILPTIFIDIKKFSADEIENILFDLKMGYENGVITEQEYVEKKASILKRFE